MAITTDQINEAKQQGYSDSEIADYLSNKGYSDQIKEARNNGYGDDEIVGFLSQKLQQQNQPEVKQEGFQEANRRRIGEFLQGTPEGLGNAAIGAVQTAADLGEAGARFVERKIYGDNLNQENFGDRLAKQVALRKQEQSQYPTSKRVGVAIGETLPYLTTGSGVGSKIASMPFKGSNIAGLAAGSGIGGLVSQGLSAQEKPGLENRINEGLKGGLTGALVGGAVGAIPAAYMGAVGLGEDVKDAFKGLSSRSTKTLDEVSNVIKQKSSAAYKAIKDSGASFIPDDIEKLLNKIDDTLKQDGIMNPILHQKTIGVIKQIKDFASRKNYKIGFEELDQYQRLLKDVVNGKRIGSDERKAILAINQIDDFTDNLTRDRIIGGDENLVKLLDSAKEEWKRYRKFDSVSKIAKRADGDPNRIKTLTHNFLNNPKNTRGFSPEEIKALEAASKNSNGEGLAKAFGKFGFDLGSGKNTGNTALPAGSILLGASTFGTAGGAAGLGLATAGTAARQFQKLSAKAKLDKVLRTIEGLEPETAKKVIEKLPPKTRDYILANLTTNAISK